MRAPRSTPCSDSGAIPVINENDTVATAEIRYGDNDRLAARVAQMASADCLVLLSDVDGLYSADPKLDPAAEFLPEVRGITPRIEAMAGGSASDVGSGGMATKIAAARIAHGCRLPHVHRVRPSAASAQAGRGRRALHLVHPGGDAGDRAQAVDRRQPAAGWYPHHRCGRRWCAAARAQPAARGRHRGAGQFRARRRGGCGRPARTGDCPRAVGLFERRCGAHHGAAQRRDRTAGGFPRAR